MPLDMDYINEILHNRYFLPLYNKIRKRGSFSLKMKYCSEDETWMHDMITTYFAKCSPINARGIIIGKCSTKCKKV